MADQTLSVIHEVPRASAIIHAPPKGKLAFSGDGPEFPPSPALLYMGDPSPSCIRLISTSRAVIEEV